MSFKILGFVYFAASVVVSSSTVFNHQYLTLHAREHVVKAVAFPLPRRQEHMWRNETTSSALSATKRTSITATHSSTISRQDHASSTVLDDTASSVATTPARSSQDSAAIIPSQPNGSPMTIGDALPSSKATPVSASQSTQVSTYEHSLSSSISIITSPSQHYTSSIRSISSTHFDATLVQISSTTTRVPLPSTGGQHLTPDVTSTITPARVIPSPEINRSSTTHVSKPTLSYTLMLPQSASSSANSEGLSFRSRSSLTVLSATSASEVSPSSIAPTSGPSKLWSDVTASDSSQSHITPSKSSVYDADSSSLSSWPLPSVMYMSVTARSTVAHILASTVVSSRSAATPPSIVSFVHESSASVAPTGTWTQSLSTIISISSPAQSTTVPGNFTSIPSFSPDSSLPASSHHTDIAPTSILIIGLPHATPLPTWSSTAIATPNGTFDPKTSAISSRVTPSDGVKSIPKRPTESQTWTSATISTTPGVLNSSTATILSASVSTSRPEIVGSTSSFTYTKVQNVSSIVTLGPPVISASQSESSVTLITVTTPAKLLAQATSSVAAQRSSKSTLGHEGWNTTRGLSSAASSMYLSGVALPTDFVTSPDKTGSYALHTSAAPVWTNSTEPNPVVNTTASIDAAILPITPSPSMGLMSSATASSLANGIGAGSTKTVISASSSASSATESATAIPPLSSHLTVSQKTGVAIASSTGLLIAVVVAIYVARRYRTNHARRSSTGSIYPKVAYLYDPPTNGSSRDGDLEEALMSGGAAGMPPLYDYTSRAPPSSVSRSQRHSTSTMPMRFSDPGNPFRGPEEPSHCANGHTNDQSHTTIDAASAFSAAIKGYRATSQRSSSSRDLSATGREGKITWPSPTLSWAIDVNKRSDSRHSILSEIASMAYNPNARYDTGAVMPQPSSPYGFQSNHSLPCVRETAYTDSCRDPFEHDLLLEVDTRTETPDFVTVYAPSTKSTPPAQASAPIKLHSRNPWASSMTNASPVRPPTLLDDRPVGAGPAFPGATIVGSERFSLVYDNDSSTTYIAPSQKQADHTMSPVSPLSGALHRGWDDIKRYSAEKVVPSRSSLSPPLGYSCAPYSKQKSLPQLRRKEPIMSGLEDVNLSSTRLSLALKIPFTHNRISSAETPTMEVYTAHDATRSRGGDHTRSPESTFSHSVHSLASLLQKKKSKDMEFACAGV